MGEGTSFLSGTNPLTIDAFSLFIVQALIIIILSRIVGYFLRYMHQPRVIAEVIGGILLGQSALGRIEVFRLNVFPPASLPGLQLVANLGLTLFLFLVGLELDIDTLVPSARKCAVISIAGIIVPFAVSIGASKAMFETVMQPTDVQFGPFLIFTGVAMSITAFPVLARILTEGKLLGTKVGQISISAAAVDDVVAWILLLVVVALVKNTGNYIIAFYVFLATVAWGMFLIFVIRPLFRRFVESGSHKDQVSEFAIFLTFVLLLVSAWFTQVVGVQAIFGAFLAGLIVPHNHGFAVKVAEKIEDIVTIVLLPLYFAFSGLNTRLDYLNTGLIWGLILLVITTACVGKIVGCFFACKISKLSNRESFSVAVLMNTKGLVELIVLNIGLQAGVINVVTFTIMVVMALFTTFLTSPVIRWVYPPSKHTIVRIHAGLSNASRSSLPRESDAKEDAPIKVLFALRSMSCVRPMMSLMQMMSKAASSMEIVALRLLPLGDRIGMLMKAQEHSETLRADPVLDTFKTFAQLHHITIDSMLSVAPMHDFADNILQSAEENNANLIVLTYRKQKAMIDNIQNQVSSFFDDKYNKAFIVDSVCAKASCSVAVFMDNGFNVSTDEIQIDPTHDTVRSMNALRLHSANGLVELARVFMIFNGGADAREALLFMLQFHRGVNVHVLVFKNTAARTASEVALNVLADSTEEHVLEMGDEAHADMEMLENLKTEIADESKIKSSMINGTITMEEISLSAEGAYLQGIQWLNMSGVVKHDLVVLGRGLFEQGKDASRHDLISQLEVSCPSSICVVQHRPYVSKILSVKEM